MAEVRVSGGGRRPAVQTISFDPTTGNFPLDFERLQARVVQPLDAACWDFLEIAAAIFVADTALARGAATRPELGAGWRRNFSFTIPVVRHDIWSSPELREALADAASFLTDDEFTFRFEPKSANPQRQYPLIDDSTATPFAADEIILFSGGLDSLSGAMDRLATSRDKVVLVTREGRTKETPRPKVLGAHLGHLFNGRVLHARFRASRSIGRARDRTQRSRSFLLAALGYVHARIFGAPKVSFYENGVISHNLPISPQVVGTMATRTTHPFGLRKLARIFDLLAEASGHSPIELANPYQWLTKAEVIGRLADAGGADLIGQAVSCTSLQQQSNDHTHCGSCSQCLDRRFAIVAMGLEKHDPAAAYQTEVFLGARQRDQSRTMALDWANRSLEVAKLTSIEFVAKNAQELARIAAGHPDLPSSSAIVAVHDLHRRHGQAAEQALSRMIAAHAGTVVARALEPTSLLRMLIADRMQLPVLRAGRQLPQVGIAEAGWSEPVPRRRGTSASRFPLQVVFTENVKGPIVDVVGLASFVGVQAEMAHRLKLPFDSDRAAGRPIEQFQYTPAGRAHPLGKGAAKRCVDRVRETLEQAYAAIEDEAPDRDLLIETKKGRGYRLDPTINVVAPENMKP